ncbi:MAG: fibronectin type III domain-containing protein [Deltaproteobacteria bacterium]|nr:fibronectin type III domain-containing protein [Deltaproteobacteria bacterium]
MTNVQSRGGTSMKKIAFLGAALLSVAGFASSALALPAALKAGIGVTGPGGLADTVVIGERLGATDGYDNTLDTPSIGAGMGSTYLVVAIPHPELGYPKNELEFDIRSLKAEQAWLLTVTTNLPAGTELSLRLLEDSVVPAGFQLGVEDLQTAATASLSAGAFPFAVTAPDAAMSFRIVVTRASEAPEAPAIGTATAGDKSASVSFSVPVFDGGSPILQYVVTSKPGGVVATGLASPVVVTGLKNGKTYTFTVRAENAVGPSEPSGASNGVTPSKKARWQRQGGR